MDTEYEVKFYPVDKAKLRKKLTSAGASLTAPEKQMQRIIFDRKYHPEFICDFVRIRDEGSSVTLTAKTHTQTGNMADEKETEIVVSDYQKAMDIFSAMGMTPDRFQETLRESWSLDGCHIDIDTWPGLDTYCEIESDSEEKIELLAQKIGFDWSTHLVTNPMDMLADLYRIPIKEVLSKAAHLTFVKNPFAGLPKTGVIKSIHGH